MIPKGLAIPSRSSKLPTPQCVCFYSQLLATGVPPARLADECQSQSVHQLGAEFCREGASRV